MANHPFTALAFVSTIEDFSTSATGTLYASTPSSSGGSGFSGGFSGVAAAGVAAAAGERSERQSDDASGWRSNGCTRPSGANVVTEPSGGGAEAGEGVDGRAAAGLAHDVLVEAVGQ